MISIIVCTHNRDNLIEECILSLLNQKTDFKYELIVVDNNSEDRTKEILTEYDKKYPELSYIMETKIGLSYARNAGIRHAKYAWVANVDDDAKAHEDFVEVACQTINNSDYDCFGGIYNAWFKYGHPKWFPSNYGTNRQRMPDKACILTGKNFSGGVAVYKKELLQNVGWFPENMGMKGEEIGYGEENYVQERARELGYTVGFVPDLQIDHLVRKVKLSKSWHYNDFYQKGISKARLQSDKRIDKKVLKYGLLEILKYPFRFLKNGSTFIGNRNLKYYEGYLSQLFKDIKRQ